MGNLRLTAPNNAGLNWPAGSSQYITWVADAVSLVNISYSLNNGSNWTWINTVAGNASPFTWNIPNGTTVSNIALVRVEDDDNKNDTYDISNNTFNLIASFNITQPEDGHVVIAENPYYILWNNAGVNWTSLGSVPNNGNYTWTPNATTALSNESVIRITDPGNANATDTGLNYFYLRGQITVTYPNDYGLSWQVGESHDINWTRKGNISTVEIKYSYNNGTNWSVINASVPASDLTRLPEVNAS
jgi:predicted nuclease of predicted toxin-antitoxin system